MKNNIAGLNKAFMEYVETLKLKLGEKYTNIDNIDIKEIREKILTLLLDKNIFSTKLIFLSKKELAFQIAILFSFISGFVSFAITNSINSRRQQQQKIAQELKDAKVLAAYDSATDFKNLTFSDAEYNKRAATIMFKIIQDYETKEERHNNRLRESLLGMFSKRDVERISLSRRKILQDKTELWNVITDGFMDDEERYLYDFNTKSGPREVAQINGRHDIIDKIKHAHEVWEKRSMVAAVSPEVVDENGDTVLVYNMWMFLSKNGDLDSQLFYYMVRKGFDERPLGQFCNIKYSFGRNTYIDMKHPIVAKYQEEIKSLIAEKRYVENVLSKRNEIVNVQKQDTY